MITNPRFRVSYTRFGFPNTAEFRDSDGVHTLHISPEVRPDRAVCDTRFAINGQPYLRLRGTVSVRRELALLLIRQGTIETRIRIDFSKYDKTHAVLLAAQTHDKIFRGTFDPDSGQRSGESITTEQFLSQESRTFLRIWTPLLREANRDFAEMQAPYNETIIRVIQHSVWKQAGRAACWGLGSVAGAAVCAGGSVLGASSVHSYLAPRLPFVAMRFKTNRQKKTPNGAIPDLIRGRQVQSVNVALCPTT